MARRAGRRSTQTLEIPAPDLTITTDTGEQASISYNPSPLHKSPSLSSGSNISGGLESSRKRSFENIVDGSSVVERKRDPRSMADLPVGTDRAADLFQQFGVALNPLTGTCTPIGLSSGYSQDPIHYSIDITEADRSGSPCSASSQGSSALQELFPGMNLDALDVGQGPSQTGQFVPPEVSPTVDITKFEFASKIREYDEDDHKIRSGWHWGNGCHDCKCIVHYIIPETSKEDIERAWQAMKDDPSGRKECVASMQKKLERKK